MKHQHFFTVTGKSSSHRSIGSVTIQQCVNCLALKIVQSTYDVKKHNIHVTIIQDELTNG